MEEKGLIKYHEDVLGEWRYITPLISALDGGEW
jgi:hypothetical protein